MHRSYTSRLKITRKQGVTLTALLVQLCELYNMALQQRRDAYRTCGVSLSEYDQHRELTELRAECQEYATFPAAIQRDPLRRIKLGFDGFFRRCRAGKAPGYPRFKSCNRYDSFTVGSQNFRIEGDHISIVKLGGFRFKTHCRIKGIARQLTVKRIGNKWQACIVCDIGDAPCRVSVSKAVGIDVGLTSLVTLSNGNEIKNPRWTKHAEERLAEANRSLSRKKRGSRNRNKAKEHLRRVHQQITGRRRSYLHGVSRQLVDTYDLIAYEKLNIKGMMHGHLAKSIMDAAWNELLWQITYKAESAGTWAVPVNPCGTSQICSGCGEKVPKKLRDRQHDCPQCGLSLGRDHNAALNILRLGMSPVEVAAKG